MTEHIISFLRRLSLSSGLYPVRLYSIEAVRGCAATAVVLYPVARRIELPMLVMIRGLKMKKAVEVGSVHGVRDHQQ